VFLDQRRDSSHDPGHPSNENGQRTTAIMLEEASSRSFGASPERYRLDDLIGMENNGGLSTHG
jgi:hypothetical protein